MTRFRQRACLAAGIAQVFAVACGSSPVAPTPAGPSQMSAPAVVGAVPAPAAVVGAADAIACTPTFKREDVTADFFLLTITVPARTCAWYARNNEPGGAYWQLTAAGYGQRNTKKYPDGVAGLGTQTVGVHFLKKIGWQKHVSDQHLDVCSGPPCGPKSARLKTWVFNW